jgi:UDP-N-acetylglucosamine--N-acetylmuramyl-(pentapeptide) pyrophosphoryl-undecaprenol N-acetylglucosamine transferase
VKVVVSGGGTGGHTLPVLAVIKSFEKIDKNSSVIFIGSRFGVEANLIPKMGIKYYGISTGKFRRYHKSKILNLIDPTTVVKNLTDFFRFLSGIKEARKILVHEKPNVVFAKGGYVSLPVGIAARLLKIPVVIHESDVVMGMANRRMASFAAKICVAFPPKYYEDLPEDKLVETGNPVREDVLMGDGEKLKREIGFSKNLKTLLILGGSQGSQFINETILEILRDLVEECQVLWIAGERDYDFISYNLKEMDKEVQAKVKVYGFVTSELADIYSASDLVITRSGSNVLFELAALGKPAIFIPHDVSPGGHQFQNARVFSRSGAGFVMPQSDLNGKKLLRQISYLLKNEKEMQNLSEGIKKFADLSSAGKVANVIYETGSKEIEQNRESQKEA